MVSISKPTILLNYPAKKLTFAETVSFVEKVMNSLLGLMLGME